MLRLSLTLLYTHWVYLSSVFSIINPVSIKPTGHLTLYISADRMICRIVIGSCFPGRFPSFFCVSLSPRCSLSISNLCTALFALSISFSSKNTAIISSSQKNGHELLTHIQKSRRETLPKGKIPRQYSFTVSGFSRWCPFPLQKIVPRFSVPEPVPASRSEPCGSPGKLLSFLSTVLQTPHPTP